MIKERTRGKWPELCIIIKINEFGYPLIFGIIYQHIEGFNICICSQSANLRMLDSNLQKESKDVYCGMHLHI